MSTEYKRIRRFNKFLTTKKISGGIRYLLAPTKLKRGPVLMASETVGIRNTNSDFILYKGEQSTPVITGEILLVDSSTKLLSSANTDVSYLNTPQIIKDSLSGLSD